jgi:hypothetical protein
MPPVVCVFNPLVCGRLFFAQVAIGRRHRGNVQRILGADGQYAERFLRLRFSGAQLDER